MHVGSVDEKPNEQGIAHFVEHVTFLGSHKRETVATLGARSNAFTDFQHTIFHVDCPTVEPASGRSLVGLTIEMLAEVGFGAEFLRTRIEKERKAVLAEAQMMNTIEYRMDCQLLKHLHAENALGHRFPIGMVDQVSAFSITPSLCRTTEGDALSSRQRSHRSHRGSCHCGRYDECSVNAESMVCAEKVI
jgi:predicted Zn-dependent peptidase